MPTVRRVLAWKIPFSILFLLPLVFLPLSAFPDIQIPEYDKVAMVFIRLLGAALVALVITQLWGVIDTRALRGAVVSAIAETALMAMASTTSQSDPVFPVLAFTAAVSTSWPIVVPFHQLAILSKNAER